MTIERVEALHWRDHYRDLPQPRETWDQWAVRDWDTCRRASIIFLARLGSDGWSHPEMPLVWREVDCAMKIMTLEALP